MERLDDLGPFFLLRAPLLVTFICLALGAATNQSTITWVGMGVTCGALLELLAVIVWLRGRQ